MIDVGVLVVVSIEIPLSIACETMYVTLDVEVSIEVVVAHVVVVTNVVDMQFFAQGIFGIPTIYLIGLVV